MIFQIRFIFALRQIYFPNAHIVTLKRFLVRSMFTSIVPRSTNNLKDCALLIRPSQTAAFSTFAANRKEVLNLSSQEDLVSN